jgi:hypothetical protein
MGSEEVLEQVELNFSFRNKFIILQPCGGTYEISARLIFVEQSVHHFTMVTWSMHTSGFHVLCCRHELSFVVCEYKYSANMQILYCNIKYNIGARGGAVG